MTTSTQEDDCSKRNRRVTQTGQLNAEQLVKTEVNKILSSPIWRSKPTGIQSKWVASTMTIKAIKSMSGQWAKLPHTAIRMELKSVFTPLKESKTARRSDGKELDMDFDNNVCNTKALY